jgi:hypothetical protein
VGLEFLVLPSIYSTPKQRLVNEIHRCVAVALDKEDDPSQRFYIQLCRLMPAVRANRLWPLTHVNDKFQRRWHTKPNPEEKEHMAYHLAQYEMTAEEIINVISVWYYNQHGMMPPSERELKPMIAQKLAQAEAHIKAKRAEAAAILKLRYENDAEYREKKKQQARDCYRLTHPESKPKLKVENILEGKLLDILKDGETNRLTLCKATGANPNTMKDCIKRLISDGRIVRLGRGLYALKEASAPAYKPWHVAADPAKPSAEQLETVFTRLTKIGNWSKPRFENVFLSNGYPHLLSLMGIETEAHTCCG